ncbi:hypothetical protein IHE45_07G007800 [Dioscorea alata]|uniref:Uncharacterized protein n=1 Tax=Dioscorea alata TaxID=55571 RepID=A0ACB7VPS8_DIOAL|nr:hypothetical protein IHE45_07G007800 [Dioscorea alata]
MWRDRSDTGLRINSSRFLKQVIWQFWEKLLAQQSQGKAFSGNDAVPIESEIQNKGLWMLSMAIWMWLVAYLSTNKISWRLEILDRLMVVSILDLGEVNQLHHFTWASASSPS